MSCFVNQALRHAHSIGMHSRIQEQRSPQIKRRSPMEGYSAGTGLAGDKDDITNKSANLVAELGIDRFEEGPGFGQTIARLSKFFR